jgi:hypothetical protein
MSAQPWNTVAAGTNLMDLMELLLKLMEEDNRANAGDLDNYLMGCWEGDDSMDANTLPLLNLMIQLYDLDLFDLMGTLIPLTVVYREYILDDLQTNVVFNSQHLHIAHLSDVECMDNF